MGAPGKGAGQGRTGLVSPFMPKPSPEQRETKASVDRHHGAALEAAARWGANPESVDHIADSGNYVYRLGARSQKWVLRLTDPLYRTREAIEAELEFVNHLHGRGVRVAAPIAARSGALVELVSEGEQDLF